MQKHFVNSKHQAKTKENYILPNSIMFPLLPGNDFVFNPSSFECKPHLNRKQIPTRDTHQNFQASKIPMDRVFIIKKICIKKDKLQKDPLSQNTECLILSKTLSGFILAVLYAVWTFPELS